ncbi:MAG: PorP/SprF family type IX secretion system membrane protein [Saprospiraceae bacterium]|nr:PorP/SprF family type IX secretion system membrane protein [Saprospiraceae bacterium]
MLKYIYTFILLMFLSLRMQAQQIQNSSHINETRLILNPALTAFGNDMIMDGFFRMQWLGFRGAPVTGYASLQYPLLDYNMSGGALLHFDKTGPVSKVGVQLNYAYKVKELIGRDDQLSLGISANFQQYSFNGGNEIFNESSDPLISRNSATSFFPSLGFGFFYNSNMRKRKRDNSFYTGFAINQIYSTDVLVEGRNQVREKHMNFIIGGRFYNYNSFIEPSLSANMVNPDILDIIYTLKYEMENSFWFGAGYAGSGMASVQGGVILDKFGNRHSSLRIGVLGTFGIGSGLNTLGTGYEFYIAYHFDMK